MLSSHRDEMDNSVLRLREEPQEVVKPKQPEPKQGPQNSAIVGDEYAAGFEAGSDLQFLLRLIGYRIVEKIRG